MRPADLPDDARALALTAADQVRGFARRAGHDPAVVPVRLEWSQAGTQHSGRIYLTSGAVPVPEPVTATLSRLRAAMARPGAGTWLSAQAQVDPDDSRWDFNHTRRPYWNSPDSMLAPTAAPAVPDDARWAADLRRYPRDAEHALGWLAAPVSSGRSFTALREALTSAGFATGGVALPDEEQTPFEGCVAVVRHSTAHYSMQVADYGHHEFLAEYAEEEHVSRAVWDYLHQPLPHPTAMSWAEIEQRARAAGGAYADLHHRLAQEGPGGIITNLAAGVPFDRYGVLDGLFFYPWGTPWPQRSLPQTAHGPGAAQVILMAPAPVEVHAQIVPAWFSQPGGGIRFRVEGARHQGLRDLVRTGVLLQIQPY